MISIAELEERIKECKNGKTNFSKIQLLVYEKWLSDKKSEQKRILDIIDEEKKKEIINWERTKIFSFDDFVDNIKQKIMEAF